MFRGANKVTLDAKGRVAMPARYRDTLVERSEGRLVATVDRADRCLLIYPLPDWEEIERKLMRLPSLNPQARRLQRLMVGHATDLELDSHGRVLVPPKLREFASLTRQAMLIGQGNRFELWDEQPRRARAAVALGARVAEHTPVLPDEVLAGLAVRADGRYCDATFGRGGHTAAILGALGPSGRVIAIDRDPDAIRAGRARFAGEPRLTLMRGSFGQLEERVRAAGLAGELDGVLMDLGVSSPQLDEAERGFSFMQDGPLDMRMDNESGQSAAQWLARASERDVASVLRELGEERYAGRIARAIVAARASAPLERTGQLAALVAAAVPTREPGKHPATRTFQAIRIHVNGELDALGAALPQAVRLLAPGGRLCVISFHSLEDRIVKRFIRREEQGDPVYAGLPQIPPHARPRLRRVGKAIEPGAAEVERNPRSRSAVLRVAERVAA